MKSATVMPSAFASVCRGATGIVEPVAICVVGIVVGCAVLGLFLPLVSLSRRALSKRKCHRQVFSCTFVFGYIL